MSACDPLNYTAVTADEWKPVLAKFSELLSQRTKGDVRNWVEPHFSTTTEKDLLVGRALLMATLKNYFAYGCYAQCGLPEVTMEGTLADWEEIRRRADRIAEYGRGAAGLVQLGWWHQVLVPVLDKFIASYKGSVDAMFWQSCTNEISYGSGPGYISGWVLAFAPFDKAGHWQIAKPSAILQTGGYGNVATSDFADIATVSVPIKINDNGSEWDATVYAGCFAARYDRATNEIRPAFDFALFRMPAGTIKDKIDWHAPNGAAVRVDDDE